MAEKKQILEEAVLDLKKIQEALNANTKEILRSVTREEINGIVAESFGEEDYEEEAVDGVDDTEDTSFPPAEGGEAEIGGEVDAIDGVDDTEIPDPNEVGSDDQGLGMDADAFGGDELDMTGASDDDVIAIYKKLSGDDEIEIVGDEIHLTISEPGEYIVKKGGLDSGMGAEEEMGGEEFGGEESPEFGAEGGEEGGEDDDEMSYEIAMDDDDEESDEESFGNEGGESEEGAEGESEEGEPEEKSEEDETVNESDDNDEDDVVKEADDIDVKKPTKKPIKKESTEEEDALKEEDVEDDEVVEESIPVGLGQAHRLPGKVDIGQPRGAGAKTFPKGVTKESVTSNKAIVSEAEVKYKKLLSEAAQLKNENEEFRMALKKFRSMLVETVVFNSNLSYVTKLFMEHSTTKDEKKKIIQRFDEEVTNLKESKRLYKTIVNELGTRKPMNESVESKIIKEVTTSTSKQLNEANAYVDPSTQRIKDLIKRVENKDKY